MYWADRTGGVIRKRLPEGRVEAISKPRKYIDIRWMTVTPGGTVYFVDHWDLLRVEPDGSVTTVARDLARPGLLARVTLPGPRHAIVGLWTDAAENIYLAVTSDRVIKKVAKDGRVSVVAKSRLPWSPTGGLVAPNGDLRVLEYAASFSARVRKIGPPSEGVRNLSDPNPATVMTQSYNRTHGDFFAAIEYSWSPVR